jgi:pimeloyl-ACP methyl ester carboxylesterase
MTKRITFCCVFVLATTYPFFAWPWGMTAPPISVRSQSDRAVANPAVNIGCIENGVPAICRSETDPAQQLSPRGIMAQDNLPGLGIALIDGIGAVQKLKAENASKAGPKVYVCPPCGLDCDRRTFDKPGVCPDCGMTLIEKMDDKQISVQGPDGEWFGELSLPNEWQLLQLHLHGAPPEMTGTLDLPLRHVRTNELKGIRWNAEEAAFEVSTPLGNLKFTGKANNGELRGSVNGLKTNDSNASFRLVRIPKLDFDAYTGGYEASNGRLITIAPWTEQGPGFTSLSLQYNDTSSRRSSSLFPISATRFISGGPAARLFPIEAEVRFETNQQGKIIGLVFQEATGAKTYAKKCTYREEQVKFFNKGVSLAGTFVLPNGQGPYPAIVLTHGSGPQRRWRGIFEQLFVRRGVAVLSYDKRGVGQSGGNWTRASFTDLAEDAVAGADFLAKRPDIDAKRIGFWGLSQGGWIASLAASRFRSAAFVMMVSGGGLTPERQEFLDTESDLRDSKFSEAEIAEALEFQKTKNAFMRTGQGWDEYKKLWQAGKDKRWYGFGNTDAWGPQSKTNPYWATMRLIYVYDPAPALESLRCPVLYVCGALDTPKGVRENVANIQTCLQKAGNRDVTIRVFPKAGHNLFLDEPGIAEKLTTARLCYSPGYLELLETWLVQRAGVPSEASP